MEHNRVDSSDAGGESRSDMPEKLSWRDRFMSRVNGDQTKESVPKKSEKEGERKVSFTQFFKGMFADQKPAASAEAARPSWIDEAFSARESRVDQTPERENLQKIESLDERTRTEFLIEVAERFRAAGERFIGVTSRGRTESHDVPVTAEAESMEQMYNPDMNVGPLHAEPNEIVPEQSPPFDFAIDAALPEDEYLRLVSEHRAKSAAGQGGAVDRIWIPTDARDSRTVVVSRIIGKAKTREVRHDGDVTTHIFRPRKRDVLIAAIAGEPRNSHRIDRIERIQQEQKNHAKRIMADLQKETAKRVETQVKREVDRQVEHESKEIEDTFVERMKRDQKKMQKTIREAISMASKNPDGVAILREPIKHTHHENRVTAQPEIATMSAVESQPAEIKELSFMELRPKGEPFPARQETRQGAFARSVNSTDSVSIKEILAQQKQQIKQDYQREAAGDSHRQQDHANRPVPSQAQNWAITAAIVAMIVISLLFISAI